MSQQLNLPSFTPRIRQGENGNFEVYDDLRRKWIVITPEEEVRQTFVNYLVTALGYPPSLMANEHSLKLNDTLRRCDTVVFSRSLRPLMVLEYKRPGVAVTSKVFDQIARYNSVIGAKWLVVSNGLHHYCCEFVGDGYKFHDSIPCYTDLEKE